MRIMLETIRNRSGARLEDIAERLSVSISTVQRWEKGTMNIPSGRFGEIAIAYGCRVADIVVDEEATDPASKIIGMFESVPADRRELALRVTLNALREFGEEDDSKTG
jgi:transcriptional regulator with XRE-family HTH domain